MASFHGREDCEKIDMDRYSVKGIYLFGSTNNCTAKLNSDIDLLIHFDGTPEQSRNLTDGWMAGAWHCPKLISSEPDINRTDFWMFIM